MEERVDVVPVSRPARLLDRGEAAADPGGALEAERPEAGPPEIRLEDEAVVARPEDDAVVRAQSLSATGFILIDLSRNAFVYTVFTSNGWSMPTYSRTRS